MKMRIRQSDELYYEKLVSFWGKLAVVLFFGVSLLFIILFFCQQAYGPIGGEDSAPNWFYIMMFCIFLPIGLLVINFLSLTVSITTEGITAAYGLFRHHIPWDNVAGYELDKGSALRQYGGYGIRYGWRKSGAVLVYNTMSSSVILLELRTVRSYRYFGFSTKHLDEVMALIEGNTG
jgi:hypothetical protein